MATFNIHAGHAPDGKKGSGAVGIVKESTVARQIKDTVIAKLRALGHTVYDCTCSNGGTATAVLKDICSKANAHTVDLDISIHLNCYNGTAKGTEVLVYKLGATAEKYARNIVNSICELGYTNRGVKVRNDLYFLKHTKNTALLIETFFCDNQDDVNRFNLEQMANAIVKGITGQITNETVTPTPQPTPQPSHNYDNWVARLQTECNNQGYSSQTVDGIPGSKTLAGCPELGRKSKGNITRLAQERLNALGYNCGAVDGANGPKTQTAVKRFQADHGLVQDGIIGMNTWRKLLGL